MGDGEGLHERSRVRQAKDEDCGCQQLHLAGPPGSHVLQPPQQHIADGVVETEICMRDEIQCNWDLHKTNMNNYTSTKNIGSLSGITNLTCITFIR